MNANQQPVRLLLVEDNPLDAALAQRLLQNLQTELPVTCFWVSSAQQAIAEVKYGHYDLMLLDYQLPGATGVDVLNEIHKVPPSQQPAVIMLTASGSEKVAVEAMRSGAKDYLRKDELDASPLTRALLSALAQKRMQDQLNHYITQTKADLRMARQLQAAMLPQRLPAFPHTATTETSALRFHTRYISTVELGGDFYDVLPLSDTEAGVFICDVMGHGVRAALVTAMIRALVEELLPAAHDPSLFLAGLNHGLIGILKHTEEPLFATAFYLVADVSNGTIHFANAGHPLPFHLNRTTGSAAPLYFPAGGSGPALGLFDDAGYGTAVTVIAPRDAVMLFTDGLFEVLDVNDAEFTHERLLAETQQRLAQPLPQLFDELIAQCRAHAETGNFADDVCLVGMEVAHLLTPGDQS